ncbi:UNVERIFIED_CONTAM: General transcription and DNA repair factor IIH subunit TFB4 [Sesamum latifolium]|uniref:General transcription and DNA repair factor IIH subunit TFB4 n=1 Tax=Sesamum latifolium TaxID=2727402 RepID=A0AAW2V069_9LAMI
MTPVSAKLYTDDVSLLMVLIDTNPFFWNSVKTTLPFSKFLSHTFRGYSGQVRFIPILGYVAIMNSIFSAQRSMVPIDSCVIGAQHSAFLQQTVLISQVADAFGSSLLLSGTNVRPLSLSYADSFLLLICILVVSYNFLSLQEWTFVPHQCLVRPQCRTPQHQTGRGKLQWMLSCRQLLQDSLSTLG